MSPRAVLTRLSEGTALQRPAVSARVGRWLGICIAVAFVTGLVSHWAQVALPPVPFPTSPAWGYRLTQGLHVAAGTAAVPLLLVKLWAVLPRFLDRPPRAPRGLMTHLFERLATAGLVASMIFLLASGLANAAQWYAWSAFSFRPAHYAAAWVLAGSVLVHLALKLPTIREALARRVDHDEPTGTVSRRSLLRATYAGAGLAVLATAGATVPWLRRVSPLAVRSGEGPQGVPINRSADAAGVRADATGDAWRLTLTAGDRTTSLSRADLEAMEQRTETLPIACVEGWSASGEWRGVRVRDLIALVGAAPDADLRVTSLQTRGSFAVTTLPGQFAADDRTLLALALNGEDLTLDHGFPCRVIAPNRPGVLQTKWVTALEVVA